MPTDAEIDGALEAVAAAARRHRDALRAGATEDQVWRAYVALNNATVRYDDLLSDAYDEVTPWDCEYLEAADIDAPGGPWADAGEPYAPGPATGPAAICVRQRRDYTVPDPARLLALAARIRRSAWDSRDPEFARTPVDNVGEAVSEIVQAGDGTVAALDAFPDELVPGNGVLMVNEIRRLLVFADTRSPDDQPADAPFQLGPDDALLYRLDEEVVDEVAGDEITDGEAGGRVDPGGAEFASPPAGVPR